MHLFMTNDLKEILAKRPKRATIKQQWRMGIHNIKEINEGYDEKSPFAKHKGFFKKSNHNFNIFIVKNVFRT